MTSIPPTGPEHRPPPEQPTPGGQPIPKSSEGPAPAILSSPFAKMFQGTGAEPSAKEMQAIINGILMQEIDEIKRQDAAWKKAMKKLKDVIEGND